MRSPASSRLIGQDAGLGGHRDEVGVARPAGHAVHVEVVGLRAAGRRAEVHARRSPRRSESAAFSATTASRTPVHSSTCSSAVRSSRSDTARCGSTIRCPAVYG